MDVLFFVNESFSTLSLSCAVEVKLHFCALDGLPCSEVHLSMILSKGRGGGKIRPLALNAMTIPSLQ